MKTYKESAKSAGVNERRGESIRRRENLKDATAKGQYPTKGGNIEYRDQPRKPVPAPPGLKDRIRTALGKALENANTMRPVTDPAAKGINERKRYKKSE